ncbi:MAG: flagellar hook-associated protein FlgK [Chthonomonadales bacterium]
MPGSFNGIEIGARALTTYQGLIDLTGHNIANVNTPGYTRQQGEIEATPPDDPLNGIAAAVGTGVQITGITGVRDRYLQGRLDAALRDQSRYDQLNSTLQRVQTAYSEPGAGAISDLLAQFFNSFQAISANPEDVGTRQVALNQANVLAARFRTLYADLSSASQDAASQVRDRIAEANQLARQVADLNGRIAALAAQKGQSSDLEDARDQLVQKLGKLVGAEASPARDERGNATGALNVTVGGFLLVDGQNAGALPTTTTMVAGMPALGDPQNAYPMAGGEVAALVEAQQRIGEYQAQLNTLAAALISQVNQIHKSGYGLDGSSGRSFFIGSNAQDIAVDPSVAADPKSIAAASPPPAGRPPAPGDGENARAIADLASAHLLNGSTLSDFYAAHVARIGSDVAAASSQATNAAALSQQLQSLRSTVSGVSLDEELTHMIQYQRAYQAAARIVTVMDDLLNRVINGMGQ